MMTIDGRLYGTAYDAGGFKWRVLFTVEESWHSTSLGLRVIF
jgi:hypothetical protein